MRKKSFHDRVNILKIHLNSVKSSTPDTQEVKHLEEVLATAEVVTALKGMKS